MLSRTTVAPVAVPGVEAAVPLTREELERRGRRRCCAGRWSETRRVVAAAGLRPEQLAGLFLVGGSSRIPLVARMLHAELGIAPTVLEQPELPVAEGALTDLPLRRTGPAPRPLIPAPAGHPAGTGPAATLPDTAARPRGSPPGRSARPHDQRRRPGAAGDGGARVGSAGTVRDPVAGPSTDGGIRPGPAGAATGLPYPARARTPPVVPCPGRTAAPAGHWMGVPGGPACPRRRRRDRRPAAAGAVDRARRGGGPRGRDHRGGRSS